MNLTKKAETRPAAVDHRAPDPRGRRRLRRRRQFMVVVIGFIALVPLALAAWPAIQGIWDVDGPHEFADESGSNGYLGLPVGQGDLYMFGLLDGPLPDVTLTAARPVLSEGSVAAATTLSICRAKPNQIDGRGIGSHVGLGDLSEHCSEVLPAEGQDLRLVGPDDRLFAAVVPLVDGSVHVTGFELTYEKDGRRTTQLVAADFTVGAVP